MECLRLPPRQSALAIATALLAGVLAISLSGCGIPRDANGTLERVRSDTLRVGVTEHPPFIIRHGTEPEGVEADLVRAFADALGAEIAWRWGPLTSHLEALRTFELDLLAAGLPADHAALKHVSTTLPYYRGHAAIGVRPGTPKAADWRGVEVAVASGQAIAAHVEEIGARAVRTERPGVAPYAAAPDWQLAAWGLEPRVRLAPERYVLAAPPGENGLLHRLDHLLAQREAWVAQALVQTASNLEAPRP